MNRVQLSNLALQHIGEDDRITSPDESSRPARILRNAWDATFEFILGEANWSFAILTRALVARAVNTNFPLALERTAFPLPADLVRLVEIVDPALERRQRRVLRSRAGPNGSELLVRGNRADHDPLRRQPRRVRRPGALAAAVLRSLRVPPRVADLRRAGGRQGPQGSRRARAAEEMLAKARKANNKFKAPAGQCHDQLVACPDRRHQPDPRRGLLNVLIRARFIKYSFNAGEISRRMEGRSDLDGRVRQGRRANAQLSSRRSKGRR
jgi:hypothetical protein